MSTLNKLPVATLLTHFHHNAGTLERDTSLGLLNHAGYGHTRCRTNSEDLGDRFDFSASNVKVVWGY